jgi:hypothetical protein
MNNKKMHKVLMRFVHPFIVVTRYKFQSNPKLMAACS